MQNLTVALDAMGGDFGPRVTVPAAVQALSHFPELKVILVGDQHQITQQLSLLGYSADTRLSIVHSDRVISNSENLRLLYVTVLAVLWAWRLILLLKIKRMRVSVAEIPAL